MGGKSSGGGVSIDMTPVAASLDKQADIISKFGEEALARLDAVGLPRPEDLELTLQNAQYNGDLSLEEIDTIRSNAYQFYEQVTVSPEILESQERALGEWTNIFENQGLTEADRGIMDEIWLNDQREARGMREAALAQMARRGMTGSGIDAANQMLSNESAIQSANKETKYMNNVAQDRRLQALSNMQDLSGQMRNQDYSEQLNKASALAAIEQFNAANSQDITKLNTMANNAATERNAAEQQRITDVNTDIANQVIGANATIPERMFGLEMGKAVGGTNQLNTTSTNLASVEQSRANLYGQSAMAQAQANAAGGGGDGIGAALIGALGSAAGGYLGGAAIAASDRELKNDIQPAEGDIDEMLNKLAVYRYKYDDPGKYGEGQRVGIMAQDLEKSDIGSEMVVEGSEGKAISADVSTLMAALSRLSERINKLEGGANA